MDELLLTANLGRETGTRASRRLRGEGRVPAVVYGLGEDPVAISVEWPELRKALTTDAGLNALIQLDIDGTRQLSIVKEIQRHPTRRNVTHVDFIRIDANAMVTVDVPVVLLGEARNVTQVSGMVDQAMFFLTINSKPNAIPTEVTVDISELEVGESIKVGDVALPDGVTTDVDPEDAVASALVTRSTLEAMRADEAAEAAEGEEGAAAPAGDDAGDDGDS